MGKESSCTPIFQHANLPCPLHLSELVQTYVHWVSDAIQPSYPVSSLSLPAFNLSQHKDLFQWVGSLHQVAKVLKLPFQHQSFQRIFRVYFLYVWLAWSPCIQRGFSELSQTPQFKSISSSVLSLLYGPSITSIRKIIVLTIGTLVHKVMFLHFNILSRFIMTFLPRRKDLLNAWLQSLSEVILEHKKIKSFTVSIVCPSICHEVMGLDDISLFFFFFVLSFMPAFSLFSFTFIRRLFSFTFFFLP